MPPARPNAKSRRFRYDNKPITQTPEELLERVEALAQRHKTELKPPQPTELQARVLEALQAHGGAMTFKKIAERTGIGERPFYQAASALRKKGLWELLPGRAQRKKPERPPEESLRLQREHAELLEKAVERHKKRNAARFHELVSDAAGKAFRRAAELWREGGDATFKTYANAAINHSVRRAVCKAWVREREEARRTTRGIPDERLRVSSAEATEDAARDAYLAVSHVISLHNANIISTRQLLALLMREHAGSTFNEIRQALKVSHEGARKLHRKALERIANANGVTRAA